MKNEKAKGSSHKIQWLNLPGYKGETWNPIIGCSKISVGCKNCYAEKMAVRLANIKSTCYYQAVTCPMAHTAPTAWNDITYAWNDRTYFVERAIEKPLHWKKPRVIFICSMGDLFHETVDFNYTDRVFEVIEKCPQHIFIVLTKRPGIAMAYYRSRDIKKPMLNLWLGATTENQETFNQRSPVLLSIPSVLHFVSCEPLLGPIDFTYQDDNTYHDQLSGGEMSEINEYEFNKLAWVICGGESGHHARPMHTDWVRSIRDQCNDAGVPFFFKQWGEWLPLLQKTATKYPTSEFFRNKDFAYPHRRTGKQRSGNMLDGVKHEEYPAISTTGKPGFNTKI